MSDLLRSALGYFNNPSAGAAGPGGGGAQAGHHHGGGVTVGFQSDETTAVLGSVISFENSTQPNSVKIQRLVAEGGFSYVYKGVDVKTGEFVAVKKMLAPDPETTKVVEQEIEFMRQFQHDNIIKFFGSVIKPSGRLKEYFISMEFCPVQLPSPPLKVQHTTQVFGQTCKAIKYLHDFGIVHRDIKLENILVGHDGLVKLVDFGSATMDKIYPTPDWSMSKRTLVEEQIAQKTTPMYRAPEMLDLWSNYPIDEHSDLWALGCLLFALNFGQHPFQDSNKLAITNANYNLPKNCSDANPIICVIRGLLKVNPTERMRFGQIFELLQSIAECNGFSIYSKLPFSPAASPTPVNSSVPEESSGHAHRPPPPTTQPPQSQYSQGGGGSGSLFSSIKGVGSNLLKNIKEQSQQYMYGGPGGPQGVQEGIPQQQGVRPPARPPPAHSQPSNVPPARPAPPSPRQPPKSQHLEFENREYEMMQQQQQRQPPAPPRPAPPKPPLPKASPEPEPVMEKVGNLLDISLDGSENQALSGARIQQTAATTNNDLLDDLFGSSSSSGATTTVPQSNIPSFADDLMWGSSNNNGASGGNNLPSNQNQKSEVNLLGDMKDPFASLEKTFSSGQAGFMQPQQPGFAAQGGFGMSGGVGAGPPLVQPTFGSMPTSASFNNLNFQKNQSQQARQAQAPDLLGGNLGSSASSNKSAGGMPKNSSTPNLLSDLILGDIMGSTSQMNIGSSGIPNVGSGDKQTASAATSNKINKSNPTIHQMEAGRNNGNNGGPNMKPNYNRHQIFDPPATNNPEKKQTLNDAFGDILSSQGFASAKGGPQTRTMNDLRKIDMLQNQNIDPVQLKVNDWREGKKKNIRALLASLHTVTWDGCNWAETNMSQMITPAQVKKTYRKACLAIHPDKQMGQEWEQLAKLLFVELNEAWAAFEETQQT